MLRLLEQTGEYDRNFWKICIEQGWTGITVPENRGGLELGLIELGVVAEATGLVTAGAPFLNTSVGVSYAVEHLGDESHKTKWLPPLAAGDIVGAIALAEAQSILPEHPSARIVNGALNGTKPFVTAGLCANVAVIYASLNDAPALAVADLSDKGVGRVVRETFDNSRCVGDLVFQDVPVDVLATGNAARAGALEILAVQAVISAYEQVGGAQACLDRARNYATERRAFGQPIAAFQSVKHRLAEMYVLVELARANTIHAAARFRQPDFLKAAAAARLSATEAYDTAARDATQIHGGIGVTWEAALHLHQRRARTLAVEQGNSLFWEDLLADIVLSEGTPS